MRMKSMLKFAVCAKLATRVRAMKLKHMLSNNEKRVRNFATSSKKSYSNMRKAS